jgi:16S rRNA processing protein RimM
MSEFNAEDLITLGRFNSPFGVQGWIKVYSYTDPMENIDTYRPWLVKQNGVWQPIKVKSVKKQGKGLIAKLDQIDSPEAARLFCEAEIAAPKSVLPELEEGEYYWSQLENLKVYTESGELLGLVDHLIETGAHDVLVVKGNAESVDRNTRLIPYVPEQVVKKIDLDTGILRVDWDPEF